MKILRILVPLVVVLGVGFIAFAVWPTKTPPLHAVKTDDPALVERGRYLARAGDCTACHTAVDGVAFAGGLPLASPIGTIYSSNITPDREHGIGDYTLDDFDRAVRHGIAPGGRTLYPAMPYPSYAKVSDDDIVALYAYFMHGVAPAAEPNRKTDIPWPLSMRWPLGAWRKLYAPEVKAVDTAKYADAKIARGAYLVQGLGHCGSCHTPRALTLQEKGLDESSAEFLAGGPLIDGWVAVNLRGNAADGLGNWSSEALVETLRSARSPGHAVIGGAMGDVVVHSTQHLNDEDLQAIAVYLKSLPASAHEASSFAASPATAQALQAGLNEGRGAELYVDNCAACHRTDGAGYAKAFPKLAGNPSVLSEDPSSMIRLVLAGASLPGTTAAPSPLGMPGFAWRLSDDETAQLVSFIRNSWGNKAPAVQANQVRKIRGELDMESRTHEGSSGAKPKEKDGKT
ncbi:MAG: c-type cytochrome [Solimonas sp.]